MNIEDILSQRLLNQQLIGTHFKSVGELISWFGAMQSQDYYGAKWAIGQRIGVTDKKIEKAFDNGEILRTHVMRPTWHFVSPEDIVWMQTLTANRVMKIMKYYNRRLGLDDSVFKKSQKIIVAVLRNEKTLTRLELAERLARSGLLFKGQALAHIVSQAELDGILCSGPRRGKQHTYALIEDRAPKAKLYPVDEALALLIRKYFQSHGPATIKDFCWWSGLTAVDAKLGISKIKDIKEVEVDNLVFYYFEIQQKPIPERVYLLPNYDEYGIAYKIREMFLKDTGYVMPPNAGQMIFSHLVIYRGKLVGLWRRSINKDSVNVDIPYFHKPTANVEKLVKEEIGRYKKFITL